MRPKKIPNTHPGKFLKEEFLKPLNISTYRLAKDIGVSAIRISEIIRGKRSVTTDTAIRLERYFGMSAEFWLKWQADYDIEEAKDHRDEIGKEIIPYKVSQKIIETSHKAKQKGQVHKNKSKIALHR